MQMYRARWKTCWSTRWQPGRNTDQMEPKSTRWKFFSTTMWLLAPPFPRTTRMWRWSNHRKQPTEKRRQTSRCQALKSTKYSTECLRCFSSLRKVIGTKWVFRVKANDTRKGRVVVQGWRQVPRVDCRCTYAPVCHIQSIWIALAFAAHEDWKYSSSMFRQRF